MWFVENSANKIGRISPAGAIKEFKVPTADADLQAISAGPGRQRLVQRGGRTKDRPHHAGRG